MRRILTALALTLTLTTTGTACKPGPCPIRPGSDYRHHVWYDRNHRPYAVSPTEDSPLTCL